jgi:hypothetical protein
VAGIIDKCLEKDRDLRAVEIDPEFAMSYASLGLSYRTVGESVLSAESTTKAWQSRDRVSDPERFYGPNSRSDRGKPRAEHWMAHEQALALARSGRLQMAFRRLEALSLDGSR